MGHIFHTGRRALQSKNWGIATQNEENEKKTEQEIIIKRSIYPPEANSIESVSHLPRVVVNVTVVFVVVVRMTKYNAKQWNSYCDFNFYLHIEQHKGFDGSFQFSIRIHCQNLNKHSKPIQFCNRWKRFKRDGAVNFKQAVTNPCTQQNGKKVYRTVWRCFREFYSMSQFNWNPYNK